MIMKWEAQGHCVSEALQRSIPRTYHEDNADYQSKRRKMNDSQTWQSSYPHMPYNSLIPAATFPHEHQIPTRRSLHGADLQYQSGDVFMQRASPQYYAPQSDQFIPNYTSTYMHQDLYSHQSSGKSHFTNGVHTAHAGFVGVAAYNGIAFQPYEPVQAIQSPADSLPNTTGTIKEIICFGKLCDIPVESIEPHASRKEHQPLRWDEQSILHHSANNHPVAELSSKTRQMLQTLATDASCLFQLHISCQQFQNKDQIGAGVELAGRRPSGPETLLTIILYGPHELATSVGDWLSSIKMYLQIPEACDCDRNVPYMNPHCLDFDQKPAIYTSELRSTALQDNLEARELQEDPFADLYSIPVLDEAPQPRDICSPLHQHQKQALTFMYQREAGWNFSGDGNDIWKSYQDAFEMTRYKNTISGLTQTKPPEVFRGGILADDMGLGKTCSMLALIASGLKLQNLTDTRYSQQSSLGCPKSTLIVVPFPLLFVWEKQIAEHFRQNSVRYLVFYGPNRQQEAKVADYDIVLTTYNTVFLEWKNHKATRSRTGQNLLSNTYWQRIVLDEAHVIRSRNTACAKAVCALQAERRWCITGTPIQNRLTDVFSLFRFLKAHPYDDLRTFEDQITRPWKLRADEGALKRLQFIMKAITIRRPKSIVSLPETTEHVETVNFMCEERAIYEKARTGIIEVLNEAMIYDELPTGSIFLNTFQRINDLRYICNHGASPRHSGTALSVNDVPGTDTQALIETEMQMTDTMLDAMCSRCGTQILGEDELYQNGLLQVNNAYGTLPSGLCTQCAQYAELFPSPFPLSTSSCPTSPGRTRSSSKITALVACIRQIPTNDKCVVFSYWTSTLDAIEPALDLVGITYLRYDGSMSRTKRSDVLTEFTDNNSIRAILVSISCGGQGLDLTAANHAFLVEPQWNPMLEEQAMARVHRLGQKKAVRLVRLVMKDTWEEKIISLQSRKLTLANLIVDRSPLKEGVDGKKQLHYLRELVA